MGPVEEAGKAVTSFMDIMKEQPATLALIVISFGLLIFVFWSSHELQASRDKTAQLMVQMQTDSNKLLASCVPTGDMLEVLKRIVPDGK
jgi:hypothetical protein